MACLICILQLVFISYHSVNGLGELTDINVIQEYWAGLRTYRDTPETTFGVMDTGLPDGCQVEQVQVLHRHSARYPSSDENAVILRLAANIMSHQPEQSYTGPLSFLNTWSIQVGNNVLVPPGVSVAYDSGVTFWTRYGHLLYNTTPGQAFYNETGQTRPLIRASTLPRVLDTAKIWAEGFFGPDNATSKYRLLELPFVSSQNSSISSFLSCLNYGNAGGILSSSQAPITAIVPLYLPDARTRLSAYVPQSMNLTVEDVFGMQALCTYEYYALGSSDFCTLFTQAEWEGFNYVYDSFMYNRASFGNPAGRSLGIGILQEIIARLTGQYITTSDNSINSTLNSNPDTFPLNQKIYFDTTNDFMILGTLTAMSIDYFKGALPFTYPPPSNRTFKLTQMTQYAGRLTTERIGCISENPAVKRRVTQYTNEQYGYSSNAQYKFVRLRLNNAILPLNTIRGGLCAGRTDGLCSLSNFVASQANASALANYQFVCFGNYTYNASRFTGDGTYFP